MSTIKFLYDELDTLSKWDGIPQSVPDSVAQNLNPKFELRPYQVEAFARFFHCYKKGSPNKTYPLHFLFNMATGSGKTLIMAGLILYLYEQGYRNFLFFVNSTNIIEKTKDNFLNPASIKYLFNQEIHIGSRRVHVTPVENFEGVNSNDINICFTTIQKLHSDLTAEKENALTFEDFRKHKVVLIADEAHHINVKTKSQTELFESWEDTVERIFTQNEDNLLLEFTATHDYATPAMVEKYRNKVIIRYDRFSKDVVIVQSDFEQRERILQALILNQYKQEVAAKYRINLKPVILFKAQRTIAQSQENKTEFHKLIDGLTAKQIASIRKSDIPLVQLAFRFFNENHISDGQLVERLKRDFHKDFCLSVNEETEKEQYQILLNSLEDINNRVRAIFAVQKLNEGWDVLNLFDIVRCYEARDTGRAKIGTTTLSEAQLIGRGARYFPFVLPSSNERFRRKFDGDLEQELRVLEITFQGNLYGLEKNYVEKLSAMLGLLGQIEADICANVTDYEGTRDFRRNRVREVFKNKVLKFDTNNPRAVEDEQFAHFVSAKDWFVFNTIYGTSEEKAFVRMLGRQMQKLLVQYEEIYLLRNEGHFAIYNFNDGQAFQPDFVLFLRGKSGKLLIYQLFIEPKGKHLKEHDRWKETFLKEITSEFDSKPLAFEDKKYRLTGVPFYNNEDENQFMASLDSVLN